jgi:hypothetical protein
VINKAYVGDVGTILDFDMGIDLSGITNHKLLVKKPDGSVSDWSTAVCDVRKLRHVSLVGDFNMPGAYYINPFGTIGDWTGVGDTVILNVYAKHT